MKQLLLVMNAYAGTRKGSKYLADIISIFNRAGYRVLTHITAGPGDAEATVQALAPQVDLVVSAGGDGTFNEAVSGILRSGADVPMGYIPCGSTNDFATSLGLSTNLLRAARDIMEGEITRYDVGRFGQRYFTYVASFGAFTKASYSTPQSVKNALGHLAYLLAGLQELSQIRKLHLKLETEDSVIEDDFIFGAISNTTSVGGILTLDPKRVDMRDGKFELLLIRAPKNILELNECIRALQSHRYNSPTITFFSAEKLQITADPNMPWTLDGEREDGHTSVCAENLHLAIGLVTRRQE